MKNDDYDEYKERQRKIAADRSASGREIGPLPPVKNKARRARGKKSLLEFCKSYFSGRFKLAFSAGHLTAIERLQTITDDGGLFALAMPRGSGKALALDTPLPTSVGWTTMGDVQVGDELYDEAGRVCRVTFVTEVQTGRPCYRVTFDDGESVVCCEDHLWTVNDRFSRRNPLTLATKDMVGRVVLSERRGWRECRYTIPVARSLEGTAREFHVAPYMLGVWLGDGATEDNRVTIGDKDVAEMRQLIERHEKLSEFGTRKPDAKCATYRVGVGRRLDSPKRFHLDRRILELTAAGSSPKQIEQATGASARLVSNVRTRRTSYYVGRRVSLKVRLRWAGVLGNKHIPLEYLRASESDRLELLRGLMDTDGCIGKNGVAEYCTKLPQLRDDVLELLASLGYKRTYLTKYINGRPYYYIQFAPTDGRRVFGLSRKADRQVTRATRLSANRTIVSIEPVQSVPVRCIQVDSPSRLYLCGRSMVPTHNTTLAEVAVLRAILYGLRRFVVLVCATAPLARRRLKAIMRELEANEKLLEDFPEACFPIKALGRIHNRASGQTLNGEPTRMELTAESVVLPTVPKAASSGAVLQVCGMEGAIRGLNVAGPSGEMLRPDMVLVDDAQTRESARSLSQTVDRESIVSSDILGLAGPDTTIAAAMLCTVIYPGDLSDRFLDHERHPDWQGVRTRMLDAMPTNMDLWDRYADVLRESLRSGDQGKRANAFYIENRAELEAGAVVCWPERKKPNEVSGLQSAMNEYIRDRRGFLAEYQNEPERDSGPAGCKELVPATLADRLNGCPRGEPPAESSTLTAFVDVGGELLWYAVCAWSGGFGGSVIDYGAWPRQNRRVFHAAEPRPGLSDVHPGMSESERIFAGLTALAGEILSREYVRGANGQRMRVERCLVDAGYQSQTVYQWCRSTPFAGVVLPSKGIGRTATARGVSEWKPRPGERSGHHWRLTMSETGRGQMVQFDPDGWKTFLYERLTQPLGGAGALTLYGRDRDEHELLTEHLAAEQSEPITLRGSTFDKWSVRPHRPDNHLLDCVVGCAVAASVLGAQFDSGAASGAPLAQVQPRKRVSLSEIQKRKMGERLAV